MTKYIVGIMFPFWAWAQDYADIVRLESYISNDHSTGKYMLTYRQIALNLPLFRNEATIIFTSPRFDHCTIADWKKQQLEFIQAMLPFGITQKISEKWAVTFVGIIRQNGTSPLAFQWGQLTTVNHRSHERLLMRYGCYFSKEYFAPFFVPIVGLDWQLSSKWRIYGNLPINLTVECKWNDSRRFGLYFNALISSFQRLMPYSENTYIQRNTNELYTYFETYLTKNFVVQLRIGHSIGRRIRSYQTDETLPGKLAW